MQLYNIILNNLRRRKAKMAFVLAGMIIGIATMVSVYSIVESMKAEMTRQVSEFGINVVITPDSGGLTLTYGGITLPEIKYDVEQLTLNDISKISELPSKNMIRVIAPKILGVDTLDSGQPVTIVGANLQEEFLVKPWLIISKGKLMEKAESQQNENDKVDKAKDNSVKDMEYDSLDLKRQDLEKINLSNDQIIVGFELAKSIGIKEGDTLNLSKKPFKVKFVLAETGSLEDKQILMNLPSAQKMLGRPDEITIIDMAVDYLAGSEEVLLAEINETLPNTQVSSLRQETLRRDDLLAQLVRFGVAISILVMLVGMVVAGITISDSVRERTREIGIFRALGFRKSHIVKIILYEGVLISVFAGIIGFGIGILTANYAEPLFIGDNIQVSLSPWFMLAAIGIAVIIGIIASLYPAYKAANLDPVEALRFI